MAELNVSRTALSSVLQFGTGAGLGMLIDGVFPEYSRETTATQEAIEVAVQVAVSGGVQHGGCACYRRPARRGGRAT